MINVAVHNGKFHLDDVTACALVRIENNDKAMIIRRSRKPEDWDWADIVLDVSEQYDNDGKKYFDHHQEDVPVYENGINYSAVGLYLKHMTALTEEEKNYLLVHGLYAVQAQDNGQSQEELGVHCPNPFLFIDTYNCDWQVGVYGPEQDNAFRYAVELAYQVIQNLLRDVRLEKLAREQLDRVFESYDQSTHFTDIGDYCPWLERMIAHNDGVPDVRAVIYKSSNGQYNVQVVPIKKDNTDAWCAIPDVSDLPGFVFRHKFAFLAGFTEHDSAIEAAKRTVENLVKLG